MFGLVLSLVAVVLGVLCPWTEVWWAVVEGWEGWGADGRLPPSAGLLALSAVASPRAGRWCEGGQVHLLHSGALARTHLPSSPHLSLQPWSPPALASLLSPASPGCQTVALGAGPQQPTSLHWPGLSSHRQWPASSLPLLTSLLESAAPAIGREFSALYRAVDFREKLPQWQAFDLVRRGHWLHNEAERWPATRAALEAAAAGLPNISYLYPDRVYFSVLTPGSGLKPHYGFTNTRLRVHLGIDIPEDCGLNVDGRILHWENGKVLVFDDSYLHWVWNRSNRTRAILLVGTWHPELSLSEREYLMSNTAVLNF